MRRITTNSYRQPDFLTRLLREANLRICLSEYAEAYRAGGFSSRENYLRARRAERELQLNDWIRQDTENGVILNQYV